VPAIVAVVLRDAAARRALLATVALIARRNRDRGRFRDARPPSARGSGGGM
jgi:hypothetical protein